MLNRRKIGIMAESSIIDGNLKELENKIAFYQTIGINYTEIGIHGIDSIIGGKVNDQNIKKARNILEKYHFITSIHAPDNLNLRDHENFEFQKKVFKASIEASNKLQAEIMVYHLGKELDNQKIIPRESKFLENREIECLSELAEIAKKSSVQICVENNYDRKSTDELIEVIKKVNHSNVGICCDFGHAFLSFDGNEKKFLQFVQEVLPYLKHVHIHDNFGIFNTNKVHEEDYRFLLPFGVGDLHIPPGMGKIPFKKVARLLKDYQGIDMMEIRYRYNTMFTEIIEKWNNLF